MEIRRTAWRAGPGTVALLVLAAMLGAAAAHAGPRPNILLVLLDNTGWGDFGAYGGGALRGAPTPNIDALAAEGLRLQNFNTEAQCTPSRSALMTGRFAIRSGTQSVPVGVPYYGLIPWEKTLAELLSDAGYATAIFGKWHLGKTPGRFPTDQGFDEWYGIPNSTDEVFWHMSETLAAFTDTRDFAQAMPEQARPWILEAQRGQAPKRVKPYDEQQRRLIDAELTGRAIAFMQREHRAGKPFFAYVPLTAMHFPTLPHPDFAGRTGAGMYADMLVQTDAYVGRLLDSLGEMGIEQDTLVIVTADNGVEDPANGDGHFTGWTGPWAGTYFTAMEGGLRVPFVARWKGGIPAGGVSNEIVHLVDLMPTLAALAGAPVPQDRPVDGVDMSAFLRGERKASGREGFPVFVGSDFYALKWHDWKVHYIWQPGKYAPKEVYSTVPRIVNLLSDPRETRSVGEPFNSWLQYAMAATMGRFMASVAAHPNIPPGAPDDFVPK